MDKGKDVNLSILKKKGFPTASYGDEQTCYRNEFMKDSLTQPTHTLGFLS